MRSAKSISICLRIGGINFKIILDSKLLPIFEKSFTKFRVSENLKPEITVAFINLSSREYNAYNSPIENYLSTNSVSESSLAQSNKFSDFVKQYLLEGEFSKGDIFIDQDYSIIRDYSSCRLTFLYNDSFVYNDESPNGSYTFHRIASYCRELFSAFLPAFSSVLIHSSGVILNGKSVLFFAPSTGGKTTVIKNSKNRVILNDDQIILRREQGEILAYATPFGRYTSGQASAKLSGIYLLEKDDSFSIEPLDSLEAVKYIWSNLPSYTYFLPNEFRVTAFQIIYEACQRVPIYRMHFQKNYVDWKAIEDLAL